VSGKEGVRKKGVRRRMSGTLFTNNSIWRKVGPLGERGKESPESVRDFDAVPLYD
jgi:hypothetical protein